MNDVEQAKSLLFTGVDLLDARDYQNAEQSFREATQLVPDNPSILINLALALSEQDKPSEACKFAEQAIAVNPKNADAHFLLAENFAKERRHADAARAYARLIELIPDAPFAKGYMLHQKMLCCDWSNFSGEAESI